MWAPGKNIKKYRKVDQGFTIVEILIVIAVAALILVVVLSIVPQAQRSRRDHQRKEDLNRIALLLDEYARNHGGKYLGYDNASLTQFRNDYLKKDNLIDPSTGNVYLLEHQVGYFPDPNQCSNYWHDVGFIVWDGTSGRVALAYPGTEAGGFFPGPAYVLALKLEGGNTICRYGITP